MKKYPRRLPSQLENEIKYFCAEEGKVSERARISTVTTATTKEYSE
jgi:hypothetical protein